MLNPGCRAASVPLRKASTPDPCAARLVEGLAALAKAVGHNLRHQNQTGTLNYCLEDVREPALPLIAAHVVSDLLTTGPARMMAVAGKVSAILLQQCWVTVHARLTGCTEQSVTSRRCACGEQWEKLTTGWLSTSSRICITCTVAMDGGCACRLSGFATDERLNALDTGTLVEN